MRGCGQYIIQVFTCYYLIFGVRITDSFTEVWIIFSAVCVVLILYLKPARFGADRLRVSAFIYKYYNLDM